MDKTQGQVYRLAVEYFDSKQVTIESLPQSGSKRSYFRVSLGDDSVIAAYNDNVKENEAFFTFLRHFLKKQLPVPQLYEVSPDDKACLLEDLGDVSLFDMIPEEGVQPENNDLVEWYKQVLSDLVRFQTEGHKGLDYSVAFPRSEFDERAIRWDLNYFKYYFLHVSGMDYDEDALQNGFDVLIKRLQSVDTGCFMYRDFQSRNVMIKESKPRYIDFQGGRKGPPHYDVVSLLYQSRAKISPIVRENLLEHYLDELSKVREIDKQQFRRDFEYFKLVRTLQVLGAYGFRGYIQLRTHFLKSIPYAIKNLQEVLSGARLPDELKPLTDILKLLVEKQTSRERKSSDKFTVSLNSFSYLMGGPPEDDSGNGGGFVFDCRGLPNPGRYAEYGHMTGKDEAVIRFLEEHNEVSRFIENVFRVVSQTIDNYLDRGFEHLMINFGCTGGQHRSVYCTEQLHKRLKQEYDVRFRVRHYQQEMY
ncbi:MAG: phosphotransferase [Bacteroidales bacterium]|nr:phosphotransferase [Bacteroidales bacterium]MCF8337946.1 phosphotransferase [Bacteroidales bacterium]